MLRRLTTFSLSRTLILALSLLLVVPVAIAAIFATTLLDRVVRRQTETTVVAAGIACMMVPAAVAFGLSSI